MTINPNDSYRQIIDVLTRSLEQAFDEMCSKRYGGSLDVHRNDDPSGSPDVMYSLDGPGGIEMHIDVSVSHVGGNVYDVATQVEEGPVQRFTYSEPASSGSSLSIAPYLGKKIARHMLDEVEQRLGKKILRTKMVAGASQ